MNGHLKRDARPIAEAEEIRSFNLQVFEKCRDILGGGLKSERCIPVACTTVPLFLDRDDFRRAEKEGISLPKVVSIVEPPPWRTTNGMPSFVPYAS
jgi:hypothetical protein